jgi:hypothetical protein
VFFSLSLFLYLYLSHLLNATKPAHNTLLKEFNAAFAPLHEADQDGKVVDATRIALDAVEQRKVVAQ